jgi:hypothetical protein
MDKNNNSTMTLREALIAKYDKIGLDTTGLDAMLKLQRKARWYRMARYMSVLLLLLAFGGTSVFMWNGYKGNSYENLALAALEYHIRAHQDPTNFKVSHFEGIEVSAIQAHFQQVNLKSLKSLDLAGMTIVGFKKCRVAGPNTVHLSVRNNKTGNMESIYQVPYEDVRSFLMNLDKKGKKYQYQIKDKMVKLFVKDETLIMMVNVLPKSKGI